MSSTDASTRPGRPTRADGDLVNRARLDGLRSQIAFALLLDTLSRPGEVRSLARVGLPAGVPTPLVVPLALADVEVPVAVVTGDPESPWPGLVRDVTGAPLVDAPEAAQIVLLDGFGVAAVSTARRGTDQDPDAGARLSVACRSLRPVPTDTDPAAAGCSVVLELDGPGVNGVRRLGVDGLAPELFAALGEANASAPAGIDCWFVTPHGDMAALPRSTRVSIVHPSRPTEETH